MVDHRRTYLKFTTECVANPVSIHLVVRNTLPLALNVSCVILQHYAPQCIMDQRGSLWEPIVKTKKNE